MNKRIERIEQNMKGKQRDELQQILPSVLTCHEGQISLNEQAGNYLGIKGDYPLRHGCYRIPKDSKVFSWSGDRITYTGYPDYPVMLLNIVRYGKDRD